MKVLHLLAQLPAQTGSGIYYTNMIKHMADDYEQAALFGSIPNFRYDVLQADRQFIVSFPNKYCPFPLPGMSDEMPYKSTRYSMMTPEMIAGWQQAFLAKLAEAAAVFKPDVILSHHLWFLTSLAAEKFASIPVIAFCHATDLRQARQHPYLLQYVQHLPQVAHVFALSEHQIGDIQEVFKLPPAKLSVLGGGYDPAIFYSERRLDKEVVDIIYAGKLSASKGVFDLLTVFDRLATHDKAIRLTVIGNADKKTAAVLRQHQQKNPQLRLLDAVSQTELAEHFRKSDIFVLPSFYEGLPLIVIEALACGLYVVSSRFHALERHLGETVNNSGAIEYVTLPRLQDQDTPVAGDLAGFHCRLQEKINVQIGRVRSGETLPAAVSQQLARFTWPGLADTLSRFIKELV